LEEKGITMGKKILFGGLFYIILELLGGIIFYIISTTQHNSGVTVMDVIKIVSITLLLFVFFNVFLYFIFVVGQKQNNIIVLHIFFCMVIIGIAGCIIISFNDYFSIVGVLFLIPILISCIIWLKR
jgi:hypothetical protein